jgi:carbamoyltransferase
MGGGENREIARTPWANSLGSLYSWITYGYGFVPLEHEYKLMGMAPYASDDAARKVADIFRQYLWLDESGLQFKRKTVLRINDLWDRMQRDLRTVRFDHVCAGLQLFTEDLLCAWVDAVVRRTGVHRVLAGGGVFMNVKANKRIGELENVEYFQAFPSCGDETLSFGAYYQEVAERFDADAIEPMRDYYLGSTISDEEAKAAVEASGFRFERPEDLPGAVADLLISGEPVARAAGPMEYGARALGNRSILADPANGDVVRVINQMVKKRDFWMPFAPMVLAERQHEYIVNPKNLPSPYMMNTFDTQPGKAPEFIAAVHNADLTCRPQILDEGRNAEMYAILKAFEARTGRGIVLNTSFNLHGFPIVRTAQEAVDVVRNSGLKHLQVGPYLVHKD